MYHCLTCVNFHLYPLCNSASPVSDFFLDTFNFLDQITLWSFCRLFSISGASASVGAFILLWRGEASASASESTAISIWSGVTSSTKFGIIPLVSTFGSCPEEFGIAFRSSEPFRSDLLSPAIVSTSIVLISNIVCYGFFGEWLFSIIDYFKSFQLFLHLL